MWTSAINGSTQISALHVDANVKVITGPAVVEPNAQNNGVTISAVGAKKTSDLRAAKRFVES